MITKEQLEEVGIDHTVNGREYYDEGPELMFDIKSQKFYLHSEVDGELTFICIVKDIEELKMIHFDMFKRELERRVDE